MADIIGTSGIDNLTPLDGVNDIIGGAGNDNIDATSGVNTIQFNSGDGLDSVQVALPRTYQFADFLTAAQAGLAELPSFSGAAYSNSYFAEADSNLIAMLPADLQASVGALQESYSPEQGAFVPGTLDPSAAAAAFNSLIGWINTSTSNVIKFGPGITLADVGLQVGSTTDYGSQTVPTEFSVSVGGSEQGMIFDVGSPGSVAGDASTPTQLDLSFQFADGTTATLADLMARANQGAMGTQNGTDGSDFLRGSLASDMLFGNGGNDQLDGGAGDDFLFGGAGDDVISGGSGSDTIYGEDGNDVMASGKDGSFMSGGAGNDVYAFNRGDGNVFIDNGDPNGAGMDTISFGGGVAPSDLVASVDPRNGNLTLGIAGSSDQITITWFDNTNGMAARPDQVIDRVQFIGADGTAQVYDLASLVQAAFPDPSAADPSAGVALVGPGATELAVDAAGGDAAIHYAETGSLFASAANQAPVAGHIDDVTVKQDATDFSFALPAGTFTDPEGAALQLSATTSNGDPLPSWLQFDAVHGTFSGTPTNSDVGAFDVKVTATDPGGLSATQSFHLTVENVNDAPTVTDGAIHVDFTQDQATGYRVAPDNFHDVDVGDSLTYSATLADGSPLPSWLQFDATNLILAGKPANGDVGDLSVIVTATDQGGLSASKAIDISVANVNDAPTATDGVASANATQDASFSYTLPANTFNDIDAGDKLAFSARMADGTDLPSWLKFDATTGAFAGTPANADVGDLSVIVTATDLAGASATKALDISVANVNDAPTATAGVASADATQDASFSYTLPANTFNDIDAGDKLAFSATMSDGTALPTWLHIDGTSGTLSGTPANADVGDLSVIVTATDLAGASATKALDISVANVNDAPTATAGVASADATQDASFSYTLPANTFNDIDAGDKLAFSATMSDGTALPTWLHIDGTSGTLSGTPANADVGDLSVIVTATDLAGASATKALDISVANVNDAPTVAHAIADQAAVQNAPFSYVLPGNVFADVDLNDSLTLSATLANGGALPTWLTFNAATGAFSGTPANGDVGALSIKITAKDLAGATATDTFNLSVANIDDAPTVAHAIADQTATALSPYSMTVAANTFSDVDVGDSLTLSAKLANGSPLPSWLSFDPSTGKLSGTAGGSGTWNIAVVATDLSGASVSDTFALTVGPASAGDPPPAGATINGSSGNDRLNGTAGDDKINGGKGKDVLSGGAGDDQLFVTADATWGSASTRTNVVTGEKVSISGKNRIYDVFDGGAGSDILLGTSGDDAILLDDSKSPALQKGPRIIGVEKIDAGAGNDVVDLTSKRYSYGDVEIDGGSGNDVLWSSKGNDVLRGGSGNDSMDGGAGNDYLDGGSGNDKLNGGAGVDILQGGSGKDNLTDTSGNGVMDGGSGNDALVEGSGNSLMIGGKGNDKITLGGGYDVIAFNRGDGKDVVSNGGKNGHATLSLGGGISYQDLSLSRSGADLILNVGNGDQITFSKWYDGRKYQAVSKLQVVAEAMPGFDAGGGNPLLDNNVDTFDFKGLVKAFDAARSHSPGLSKWTVTNALAQFHLGGSDTAAVGGDLAYQYGVNGTLAGIAVNGVQAQVGSSQFGKQAQTLHNEAALKDGAVKLS